MTDDRLGAAPIPSTFRPHGPTGVDELVAASWEAVRPIASGLHDYDRNRLTNAVAHFLPALHDIGLLRPEMTWMEVGSGIGMKSLPIAAAVDRYLAVEFDEEQSARAAALARACGIGSVRHLAANAADVAADPDRFDVPARIDVLLLYAVLEHLLPEERLPVYDLMGHVLDAGGAVVIMETPNRLIPFDGHTTQLHFFHMLPDDLAIEYTARSRRAEIRDPLLQAPPDERRRVLYRNGRGLSYHDFEVGLRLETVADLPIRADGFDVHLLNQEPLSRQEVALCRYFRDNDLPATPAFGRSWIEFVAGHNLTDRSGGPSRLVHPTDGRFSTWAGTTFWSLDAYRAEAGGPVVFGAAHDDGPTATLLIDLAGSTGETEVLDARDRSVAVIDTDRLRAARLPTWHDTAAVELSVAAGAVTLRPGPGSTLVTYGLLR